MRIEFAVLFAILVSAGTGCDKKIDRGEFQQAHRTEVEALVRGREAVIKSVDAAAPAVAGATCEMQGLKLAGPMAWSDHGLQNATPGNTEMADIDALHQPPYEKRGAHEDYLRDLKIKSPVAEALFSAAHGPAVEISGLFDKPLSPGPHPVDWPIAKEFERAKAVRYLVVTKASHDWSQEQVARVSAYLVELLTGTIVCGFGVAGSPDSDATTKAYKIVEKSTGRTVGRSSTDGAAISACRHAEEALKTEIQKRFGFSVEYGSGCDTAGSSR